MKTISFEELGLVKIRIERELNGGKRHRITRHKYDVVNIEQVGERLKEVHDYKRFKRQQEIASLKENMLKVLFANGRCVKALKPEELSFFSTLPNGWCIVDMNEFYNVLKEQSSKLERSLWALVMNNINSNAMNPAIQVTNTKTTQALESLGIKAEGVDVDMVLKEFWKGE